MWIRCQILTISRYVGFRVIGRSRLVEQNGEIGPRVYLNDNDAFACQETDTQRSVGAASIYLTPEQPGYSKWHVLRYSSEAQAAKAYNALFLAINTFNKVSPDEAYAISDAACPKCIPAMAGIYFMVLDTFDKGEDNE